MIGRDEPSGFASISDFTDKCRICLSNYGDMVDIFASGISDQMMEITNVKISYSDKLPRTMCSNCSMQLNEFHKFRCLAKDSDKYLRELLKAEEALDPLPENISLKNIQKKKRKIHGKFMRLKNSPNAKETSDKMYLILVTEPSNNTSSQSEICIKDLDGESENPELADLCKSFIKNQCCDDSTEDVSDGIFYKTQTCVTEENNDKDLYKVNLYIYNCSQCDESFEMEDLLMDHLINYHKIQVLNQSYSYTCPVCLQCESHKNLFVDHLKQHKNEGLKFFKVDTSGNQILPTICEKEVFEVPNVTKGSVTRNKIYKINTNSFKCVSCKKVESISSVDEHSKMCFPSYNKTETVSLHMKYSCPACCNTWIDNFEAMNSHFASHKADNIFFIKVDDAGDSVDVMEGDGAYTRFETALEMLSGSKCHAGTHIIKIQDFYTCIACDFKADSANTLSEHYMEIHDEIMPATTTPCPVCSQQFKFSDSDEFLDHLRSHKSEGIVFFKANNDGSDNSDLFSELKELFTGKVKCPELEFINEIFMPELLAEAPLTGDELDDRGSNREYVCEKCGRKCFGRGNYKRHFTTHTEKTDISTPKRPSCSECSKTFSNRAALNEHRKHHATIESDDESGRKICEICGRRFTNNASLAKHRRLHVTNRDSSLLKCKICGRGFRREAALKKHVSYHLNPNYFECEVCKLPLPSSASLQRHKLWHQGSPNTFDCKVCKVSFLTKDRLTAHQTHTGHHQDRKRFECNVCHERFFIGREFSQHIKLHPKYKMSECSLCGKRLSTVQSLMLHLSRHFESNSILCPHCGKLFFEERNYHRHLLTHKGVKPFSCDFEGCKKSFYTYFELNRHKKYHNNTRDFSCPYCPKSFHEANHLKVHIRTHTGERPYTCPHCNKGFVTRTRCKQHINLIHQGVGCDLIQSSISKKVAVFEALETVS